jgi:hypothetical protein
MGSWDSICCDSDDVAGLIAFRVLPRGCWLHGAPVS